MCEYHNFAVPVNILTPFAHAPFSRAAQHTTMCLYMKKNTTLVKIVQLIFMF